jgi:hypothetical protein
MFAHFLILLAAYDHGRQCVGDELRIPNEIAGLLEVLEIALLDLSDNGTRTLKRLGNMIAVNGGHLAQCVEHLTGLQVAQEPLMTANGVRLRAGLHGAGRRTDLGVKEVTSGHGVHARHAQRLILDSVPKNFTHLRLGLFTEICYDADF